MNSRQRMSKLMPFHCICLKNRQGTPRLTKCNLRDSGLNVVQPPYNSLVMHNSYLYMIAHIWNQLPTVTKSPSTLAQFRARLNNAKFTGCQCMNCI